MSPERRPAPTYRGTWRPEVASSADPARAELGLSRLAASAPEAVDRLEASEDLLRTVVTVMAASPFLTRTCVTDPKALDVLSALDQPVKPLELQTPGGQVAGGQANGGEAAGGPAAGEAPGGRALGGLANGGVANGEQAPGGQPPGGQTGGQPPAGQAPGGQALGWLSRWKALEVLRVAALDLSGRIPLETVGALLADLADGVLQAATEASGLNDRLAVVGMGKLGAQELNYGSDVDIVLVGSGDPQPLLARAREAWRIDLGLRPEGRSGPLVRTLASYIAYWDRWAETWEFQALLKARPAAGQPGLGREFAEEASRRVWGRPLGADELRSLRAMKARAEDAVARQGLSQREIKLGRGGIRDIEFAVQLLQLVHGRQDESLRARATLDALRALSAGGYVDRQDADGLAEAYRFLRAVEHRLQLFWDRQVHALPPNPEARAHLARVLGYRDGPASTALARFEADLASHQRTARSIHERLYFRPLLEAFTSHRGAAPLAPPTAGGGGTAANQGPDVVGQVPPAALSGAGNRGRERLEPNLPDVVSGAADQGQDGVRQTPPAVISESAIGERLSAFGFSDARRTSDAVVELTHGFSRTSRLMQAMVPLVLDWLSESPDPDLGLLGLRRLATGPHRRASLNALFRESPEAARHLSILLGTSPLFAGGYEHHPEQLALLQSGPPELPGKEQLERRAVEAIAWRDRPEWWRGLASLQRGELLRAQARDVLGLEDVAGTGRALARLAEAVLEVSLRLVAGGGREARSPAGAQPLRPSSLAAGPARVEGVERVERAQGAQGVERVERVERVEGAPSPQVAEGAQGLALVAMGRFGGSELAYASDLDLLFVFDDAVIPAEEAEGMAEALLKFLSGETPVQRLYELDMSLRPEGRKGSLARSLKAYEGYYDRWAQVWERQALLRGRVVAGDASVGRRFEELASQFLWGSPLSEDDVVEIRRVKARIERERVPAGEDPEFHLKLGPGSLSDVEWTVQLLQLRNGISAEGTLDALDALAAAGLVAAGDAMVLAESYRFCEATRNRLYLVRGRPGDALPPPGHHLTSLARSLGTTAPALRDQYRRLTRRARRVTERLFYGSD